MRHKKIGSDLQQAFSRGYRSNDPRNPKARGGATRQKLELSIDAKRQLLERRARCTVDEGDSWKVDDAAHSGLLDAVNDLFS